MIIVSNRLPFTITMEDGKPIFTTSSGGLVSALKSYISQNHRSLHQPPESLWIGCSNYTESAFRKMIGENHYTHQGYTVHPVFMTNEVRDKYYHGFSNDTIWPLFHYFPTYTKYNDSSYEHYKTANELFAQKIIETYEPGDIIWIHDYHLMLLPGILRKSLPEATIGFFLHIPFPSFELFRLLPEVWRNEILDGILGSDLVGFHTNDYVSHFHKAVHEIKGYPHSYHSIISEGRKILTGAFPVGIDFPKFNHAVNDPDIFKERNAIRKRLTDQQLIVSVDRLDYTKGIVRRLESFELFLEENPSFHNKVTYLALVVPSRTILTKYNENKRAIEEAVGRINGKFGSIHWTPIVYEYRSLEFEQLAGLYLAADVALITPVRDGMNLVAKEFVATRNDKKGVLILSETAGAARELGEALVVNPSDRPTIALAIRQALEMPAEEQFRRLSEMQKILKRYDVIRWADDFFSSLATIKEDQELLRENELKDDVAAELITLYTKTKRRLVFLDYDGTLAPLESHPELAIPNQQTIDLLRDLAEDKRNTIVLVSGRSPENLENWFGHMPIQLVAEHGSFIKLSNDTWRPTTSQSVEWKDPVMKLMQEITDKCSGSVIENKSLSIAWHYRNTETENGFQRSRELINSMAALVSEYHLQVCEGHFVVEVRLRGIDKGTVARVWLKQQKPAWDFILAIGDDKTDEDLFRILPENAYSIRVGMVPTLARFNIPDQENTMALLTKLSCTFASLQRT